MQISYLSSSVAAARVRTAVATAPAAIRDLGMIMSSFDRREPDSNKLQKSIKLRPIKYFHEHF